MASLADWSRVYWMNIATKNTQDPVFLLNILSLVVRQIKQIFTSCGARTIKLLIKLLFNRQFELQQ